MISETIPVLINRVRVKDIVFKSSLCFLLNCLIYSPIQTLKRLEDGSQLGMMIEFIQAGQIPFLENSYERKCLVFGLISLFKNSGRTKFFDNYQIFRTILLVTYCGSLIENMEKEEKIDDFEEAKQIMDIKRELIKIVIAELETENGPDGDFRKLGFGDEDMQELSIDDALDNKRVSDIQTQFLSDLKKKDEFYEFEKFGKDF